jgi:hypothetical protein
MGGLFSQPERQAEPWRVPLQPAQPQLGAHAARHGRIVEVERIRGGMFAARRPADRFAVVSRRPPPVDRSAGRLPPFLGQQGERPTPRPPAPRRKEIRESQPGRHVRVMAACEFNGGNAPGADRVRIPLKSGDRRMEALRVDGAIVEGPDGAVVARERDGGWSPPDRRLSAPASPPVLPGLDQTGDASRRGRGYKNQKSPQMYWNLLSSI